MRLFFLFTCCLKKDKTDRKFNIRFDIEDYIFLSNSYVVYISYIKARKEILFVEPLSYLSVRTCNMFRDTERSHYWLFELLVLRNETASGTLCQSKLVNPFQLSLNYAKLAVASTCPFEILATHSVTGEANLSLKRVSYPYFILFSDVKRRYTVIVPSRSCGRQ